MATSKNHTHEGEATSASIVLYNNNKLLSICPLRIFDFGIWGDACISLGLGFFFFDPFGTFFNIFGLVSVLSSTQKEEFSLYLEALSAGNG